MDDTSAPGGPTRGWRRLPPGRILAPALGVATVALLLRALLTPAAQPANGGPPGPAAPEVGHYAPDTTLLDASGNRVDLKGLRLPTATGGRANVVVLNFWYIACDGCRTELPALERRYEADKGSGFVVVGIDIADDAASMARFAGQLGLAFPLFRDDGGRASAAYQLDKTPSSFVIDRAGVIRHTQVGPFDDATLRAAVSPLLAS